MAVFMNGNMWGGSGSFIITTNSFVKKDGNLVMGRGIAKQACNMFKETSSQPNIASHFGKAIKDTSGHLGEYNLILPHPFHHKDLAYSIGAFQVKYHWADKADYDLIRRSTIVTRWFALTWHWVTINLNFPGIGNGHLDKDKVYDIVRVLPDNVIIWSLN